MKIVVRALLALVGLALLWWALQVIASETGEVVVVTSTAADGRPHETRLWVVDHDGAAWLRSGSPGSGWYQNLRADPSVVVVRGGVTGTYEAVPEVEARAVVNQLMREKYGWRDAYVSLWFSRDDAVPIRLVELSPGSADEH